MGVYLSWFNSTHTSHNLNSVDEDHVEWGIETLHETRNCRCTCNRPSTVLPSSNSRRIVFRRYFCSSIHFVSACENGSWDQRYALLASCSFWFNGSIANRWTKEEFDEKRDTDIWHKRWRWWHNLQPIRLRGFLSLMEWTGWAFFMLHYKTER